MKSDFIYLYTIKDMTSGQEKLAASPFDESTGTCPLAIFWKNADYKIHERFLDSLVLILLDMSFGAVIAICCHVTSCSFLIQHSTNYPEKT